MAIRKDKTELIRENGLPALAQAPQIISASRSTDIPAFYADWFFHRLKVGEWIEGGDDYGEIRQEGRTSRPIPPIMKLIVI